MVLLMTPGKILKTELEIWNSLSDQNKRLKWILILFGGLTLSPMSCCLTSHQILLFQSNRASLVMLGGLWRCACALILVVVKVVVVVVVEEVEQEEQKVRCGCCPFCT